MGFVCNARLTYGILKYVIKFDANPYLSVITWHYFIYSTDLSVYYSIFIVVIYATELERRTDRQGWNRMSVFRHFTELFHHEENKERENDQCRHFCHQYSIADRGSIVQPVSIRSGTAKSKMKKATSKKTKPTRHKEKEERTTLPSQSPSRHCICLACSLSFLSFLSFSSFSSFSSFLPSLPLCVWACLSVYLSEPIRIISDELARNTKGNPAESVMVNKMRKIMSSPLLHDICIDQQNATTAYVQQRSIDLSLFITLAPIGFNLNSFQPKKKFCFFLFLLSISNQSNASHLLQTPGLGFLCSIHFRLLFIAHRSLPALIFLYQNTREVLTNLYCCNLFPPSI